MTKNLGYDESQHIGLFSGDMLLLESSSSVWHWHSASMRAEKKQAPPVADPETAPLLETVLRMRNLRR